MNKGIRFLKSIIFGQYWIGQWPIKCWFISCMFFIIFHGDRKSLLQENEYNWAISYQMKKEICFDIYNQLIRTTLHRLVIYSMFVWQLLILDSTHLVFPQVRKVKKILPQKWTRSWFIKCMMWKLLNVESYTARF